MLNDCERFTEPLRRSTRFTNNYENAKYIPPNTVSVTVARARLDTFIPTILEVQTTNIIPPNLKSKH